MNDTATVLYDYDRDDPTFPEDLRASRFAVWRAAQYLNAKGYPVMVNPTFLRPSVESMSEYRDWGDMHIVQRIEVKQRVNLTFTSKSDFPFDTLIVDRTHAFDHAKPKPYAYFIFNRTMDVAFIVFVKETRNQWVIRDKFDVKKNRTRSFYEVPIALVHCVRVDDDPLATYDE